MSSGKMSVEKMMDEIWAWLPKCSVELLLELCTELAVPVLEDRKGDRRAVFNIVNRHLTNPDFEDPAKGSPVFTQAHGILARMFADDKSTVKLEVTTPTVIDGSGGSNAGIRNAAPENQANSVLNGSARNASSASAQPVADAVAHLSIARLRDFKIDLKGVPGGGLAEGTFDYTDLCFQMQQGRKLGYSQAEIRAGVIKAMKPNQGRTFFQGNADMPDTEFMSILRSKFGVKNSQKLMDEMVVTAQKPDQTEIDFVMDMLGLRDVILTITNEEETPQPRDVVMRRFFHALSVGFRKDTVRLEMRPLLKEVRGQPWLSDSELCHEVRQVMERELEHLKMVGEVEASANLVNTDTANRLNVRKNGGGESRANGRKDDELLSEVKKMVALQTAQGSRLEVQSNDISVMKMKIAQLKDQRNQQTQQGGVGYSFGAHSGWNNGGFTGGNLGGGANNGNAGGAGGGNNFGNAGNGGNNFGNSGNSGNNRGNFQGGRGGFNRKGRNPVIKCEPCQLAGLRCDHCNLCGELGHKRYNCPKNI